MKTKKKKLEKLITNGLRDQKQNNLCSKSNHANYNMMIRKSKKDFTQKKKTLKKKEEDDYRMFFVLVPYVQFVHLCLKQIEELRKTFCKDTFYYLYLTINGILNS